jgi:hypothetical protein
METKEKHLSRFRPDNVIAVLRAGEFNNIKAVQNGLKKHFGDITVQYSSGKAVDYFYKDPIGIKMIETSRRIMLIVEAQAVIRNVDCFDAIDHLQTVDFKINWLPVILVDLAVSHRFHAGGGVDENGTEKLLDRIKQRGLATLTIDSSLNESRADQITQEIDRLAVSMMTPLMIEPSVTESTFGRL